MKVTIAWHVYRLAYASNARVERWVCTTKGTATNLRDTLAEMHPGERYIVSRVAL